MIDYVRKAFILDNNYHLLAKRVKYNIYALNFNDYYKANLFTNMTREEVNDNLNFIFNGVDSDLFRDCMKINNAFYQRKKRLYDRIEYYLSLGNCYFLTLTFSDESLKLSEKYRRDLVSRFLKSKSDYYVANIDFGELNEREHYHAVIVCDNNDFVEWSYYGFVSSKLIRSDSLSCEKVSTYISKLTNHAIKNTTRCIRLIYPKKRRVV